MTHQVTYSILDGYHGLPDSCLHVILLQQHKSNYLG